MATYYVGQSAAGSGDGSSYSNRAAVATFNAGTAPFDDLAGDTVYFCGTITTGIVVPSGGASGSPLVLRFDDETNPGLFDSSSEAIGLRIVSLDYIDIHGRGVGDNDIAIQNVTTSGMSIEGTAGTAGDGHTIRVFDMYIYGTGNQAFQHLNTAEAYYNNIRGSGNADDGFSMHDDTDCIIETGLFEDNSEAFGTTNNAHLVTYNCKALNSSTRMIGNDVNAVHEHYDFEGSGGEIGTNGTTGSILLERFKVTTPRFVGQALTLHYGLVICTQETTSTDMLQLHNAAHVAEIINCTFIGSGSRGIFGNYNFGGLTIHNCFMSGFGDYALRVRTGYGDLVSSNNAFYGNTINFSTGGGYFSNPGGADPILSDPLFVGAGDYHLTADSPLKGAGVAISGLHPTTDPDGVATATPPSIGAFEYVGGGAYVDLAGSLNTTSQLTASLKRYIGMAGSANFTFSAENVLKATRKVQGTLETSGSLDGTTKVARGISGLINAKADMSLAIGFMVNLSGIIEAGGDAAGQIKIVKDILGNVSSTSSLAGVVKSFRGMDGNILIPSSLNGTSKATRNLIGASETVSDLAASLKPIRGISGVIDSRAEVAGFTSIFKTIIGAIASKANLSAALELFGTIEFSGSISTKGEMASNLQLNLSLSGEVTTAPSLKGNIRTFKTLSGALETVASIIGDAMRIQGFSGDIASATSIEGYLVRDRVLSGAITSSIDVNGKVKIILYFSGSMDSLASLIASLSTFIPSTLENPIDVSIVSVSTQRELYSIK